MRTAAAVAHVNRLPVRPCPATCSHRGARSYTATTGRRPDGAVLPFTRFRPVSRYFDRTAWPEQLLTARRRRRQVLTDPLNLDRIGQNLHRPRQSGQQLLGPSDAIEVTRHRTEAVIHRGGSIGPVFQLLQYPGLGRRDANTSPGRNSTGKRLTCATAAAVTMLLAPGPMELVQAIIRRLREALAKAIAAWPMACSL